jgi:tetratricopeptide (TPR) repeat protein
MDDDQKITDLTEVLRLNPNNAHVYYSRGVVYANKRDFDRAVVDLTEAVRLNPNNAASAAALAKVKAEAQKAGQPKEAVWFNSNDDVPVVMLKDTKAKAAEEKARAEGDWIAKLTGDGAGFRQEKNGRAMTLSVKGNSMVGFVKSAFRGLSLDHFNFMHNHWRSYWKWNGAW